MVAVRLVAVNVLLVLEMFVTVVKLSVEDSHRVTVPIMPLRVKLVELVPEQTPVPPAMVPPTEAGETVMVTGILLTAGHKPLFMTAL